MSATDLKPSELAGYVQTPTGLTVPAPTAPVAPQSPETPAEKPKRVLGYFPCSNGQYGAPIISTGKTLAEVKKILADQPDGHYAIFEIITYAEVCEEVITRKVCK